MSFLAVSDRISQAIGCSRSAAVSRNRPRL